MCNYYWPEDNKMNKAYYYPLMTAAELYRLATKGKTHPKLVRSDRLNDAWFGPKYSADDIASIREYENRTMVMVMKSINKEEDYIPDIDGMEQDAEEAREDERNVRESEEITKE